MTSPESHFRTIPALAGEPPGWSITVSWGWDHPRAGGGTTTTRTPFKNVLGPSPRWRGNRLRHIRLPRHAGTIPALAGEPVSEGAHGHAIQDHPRAGGGTQSICSFSRVGSGPSPRWRGNHHEAVRRFGVIRTIPALAGEPMTAPFSHRRAGDHPRAGGGTRRKRGRARRSMGPSPRWRGNRLVPAFSTPEAGTIPALAGEPPGRIGCGRFHRDHPRAGGGTVRPPVRVRLIEGPSPRWRGNPWPSITTIGRTGTIPALAGEPVSDGIGCGGFRDHPRAGGGTCIAHSAPAAQVGPSPRWRGNPSRRRPAQGLRGTIPALAGEPLVGLFMLVMH